MEYHLRLVKGCTCIVASFYTKLVMCVCSWWKYVYGDTFKFLPDKHTTPASSRCVQDVTGSSNPVNVHSVRQSSSPLQRALASQMGDARGP